MLLNIAVTVIKSIVLILLLLLAVLYMTWLERRLLGRFQLRYGPNRVGPFGLLQPLADGIKLLFKEDFRPVGADRFIYLLAPAISVITALFAFAVIPLGPSINIFGYELKPYIADVSVGILLVLAVSSLGVYGIVLGGWSSNSKYSLIGSLRSAAQLVSYELAVGLAVLSVLLLVGNLRLTEIVRYQEKYWLILLQPLGFIMYLLGAFAETNRAPFDLPEAEQELTAGYHTEYGGMKWAMFFLAEYVNIITVSAIATTLFFGGWLGPGVNQFPALGFFWFALKVFGLVFCFMWVRATLPRVRYDQLMSLGWKLLVPLGLVNIMIYSAIGMALR